MEAIGSTHGRNEVWDEEFEEVILDGKPLSAPIPSKLDDISWEKPIGGFYFTQTKLIHG